MSLIDEVAIIKWTDTQYIVKNVDIRCSGDVMFLTKSGNDFVSLDFLEKHVSPVDWPLFDSMVDAEDAWDKYRIAYKAKKKLLAQRSKILKKLKI